MEDADESVRQLPQRGTPGVDGLTVAAVGERLVSHGVPGRIAFLGLGVGAGLSWPWGAESFELGATQLEGRHPR